MKFLGPRGNEFQFAFKKKDKLSENLINKKP